MKKFLIWFFLCVVISRSFANQSVFMAVRELPVSGKTDVEGTKTIWLSGERDVRIDYATRPGQSGQRTTLIHFPDVWYYDRVSNEGSYVRDDGTELRLYPVAYNEKLKQLRYGHELEFMQKNGFSNSSETVEGSLCNVWEAFADGFLATLYVKQTSGVPFQLEIRRDDTTRELVKKIRYDEYESGRVANSAIFAVPSNVLWISRSIPPEIFTNRTGFTKWLQGYYKNPDPDKVADALVSMNYHLFEKESSTAIISCLFQRHPDRVEGWVKQTENFRTWLRQACLEALWLTDTPSGRQYLQQIADTPQHQDFKYVTEVLLKKTRYTFLDLPLTEKNVPEQLMGAFRITGDSAYIQRLLSAMGGLRDKNGSGYAAAVAATKQLAMGVTADPSFISIIHTASAGLPPELQKIAGAVEVLASQYYEAADIPTNSPLSTAESNQQEAEFWARTLSELWKLSGGEPDQGARNLISEYSLNFSRSIPSRYFELAEQNRSLDARIKEKLQQFPGNLALLWMQGELYSRAENGLGGNAAQATDALASVFEKTVQSKGISMIALIYAERLADYYEGKKSPAASVWQTNSLNAVVSVLTQGGFKGSERRIVAKHFLSINTCEKSGEYLDSLYTRLVALPEPDLWLRELLAGKIKVAQAWEARGGDYAEYVTREMGNEFKARLWEARKHFTKAWELEPGSPEPAAQMITVCTGEGKKYEMRQWFDRAVALQADDIDAYSNYRFAIRPRWLGSHSELFGLGRQALKTGRFDTLAPLQYLNCLYDIAQEVESVRDMTGIYPELCPMVREFYEKTPANPPLYLSNTFWLGLYAWGSRDYKTAENAFTNAAYKYQNQVLRRVGGWPMLLGEAKLANSVHGQPAMQAFALEVRGQYASAKELYEKILKASSLDTEYVCPFIRDRIEQLRIRAGLESGEWVNITPSADLAGWTAKNGHTLMLGKWALTPDGWLEAAPIRQDARLLCNTSVGDNFELKGEFDLSQAEQLGLIFGYSSVLSQHQCTLTIDRKTAAIHSNYSAAGKKKAEAPIVDGTNTFHLQVWNKAVTLHINGQKVFDGVELGKDWWGKGEGSIGLGDSKIQDGKTRLRYKNLQLHRMLSPPALAGD